MVAAKGWAVVQKGELLVRTVSPTRRAALVNWLVVEAAVRVGADWNDARIEHAWECCRLGRGAEAVAVTIKAD